MSGISLKVWEAEERVVADNGGIIPDTPFWNMVSSHFDNALETGNLARFEHYHGPMVTAQEEQLHAFRQPPVNVEPIKVTPPPIVTHTPIVTCPPVTTHPSIVTHHPIAGAPHSGTVPEPSSGFTLGIGIILSWAGLNLIIWIRVLFGWLKQSFKDTPRNAASA